MLLVIPRAFLNKQTDGIILNNHSPWQVVNCDMEPCFEFKTEGKEVSRKNDS